MDNEDTRTRENVVFTSCVRIKSERRQREQKEKQTWKITVDNASFLTKLVVALGTDA